jgi:hypothetical protein
MVMDARKTWTCGRDQVLDICSGEIAGQTDRRSVCDLNEVLA